jgi:hypothetical protein
MSNIITEFGDFQTPIELASRICRLLATNGHAPRSVLEPTCGVGGFVEASSTVWPGAELSGVEINPEYVAEATKRLSGRATIQQGDFFTFDWGALLERQIQPMLVVGNLPWVTNAKVGSIGGSNLPEKSNFKNHKGFDAITGKSNFDISEWMLIQMLSWFTNRKVTLALLCKSAVARKALIHAWKNFIPIRSAIYLIDAKKEFNVSVDACLLIVEASSNEVLDCPVFPSLDAIKPQQTIGYRQKHLISEVSAYEHCRHLIGISPFKWRSGIKHDCSKVMEFTENDGGQLVNNLGEIADFEDTYLFPMLKSSCIANGRVAQPRKWMLVPQHAVNESTAHIAEDAPKTWEYLMRHKALLEKRGSSIYKDRSPFSIFGVGEYSFSPWKVAISGFYHSLDFRLVTTHRHKPIVVDDTINFIPCQSREEANLFLRILNSELAREFFGAFIFWDAKRPITTEILQKLNLLTLAEQLGESIPVREYEGAQALLLAYSAECLFPIAPPSP